MKTNIPTENNFENRPNYERKIQRTGKIYHFTKDPIGRFIKTAIGILGDRLAGEDIVFRRNFLEQGVGEVALFKEVMKLFPWFREYYYEKRGEYLTESIIWNRYHKMYYVNGKDGKSGTAGISQEHYKRDQRLFVLVPRVDALLIRGTIIRKEEIEEPSAQMLLF